MDSLAARMGAADGTVHTGLPRAVEVEPCVDRAQEVAALGARLHAWRLAGVPASRTAVLSGRIGIARDLLAATGEPDSALRVGELGLTDTANVEALALVGCDHAFFAAPADRFGTADSLNPREQARLVLRACAAPRAHLLITWRGRPERLFEGLAEA